MNERLEILFCFKQHTRRARRYDTTTSSERPSTAETLVQTHNNYSTTGSRGTKCLKKKKKKERKIKQPPRRSPIHMERSSVCHYLVGCVLFTCCSMSGLVFDYLLTNTKLSTHTHTIRLLKLAIFSQTQKHVAFIL